MPSQREYNIKYGDIPLKYACHYSLKVFNNKLVWWNTTSGENHAQGWSFLIAPLLVHHYKLGQGIMEKSWERSVPCWSRDNLKLIVFGNWKEVRTVVQGGTRIPWMLDLSVLSLIWDPPWKICVLYCNLASLKPFICNYYGLDNQYMCKDIVHFTSNQKWVSFIPYLAVLNWMPIFHQKRLVWYYIFYCQIYVRGKN